MSHRELRGGNQALHLAATTGNVFILQMLIQKFKADPYAVTHHNLTLMHCAAQEDRGIITLIKLQREYSMDASIKDRFGGTPLHFAVLNMEFKVVECLLGFDADPNVRDSDGKTPLHLAVGRYVSDSQNYFDYKRIMKELLFNGAKRDIADNNDQTPLMMLEKHKEELDEYEFSSLEFILVRFNCLTHATGETREELHLLLEAQAAGAGGEKLHLHDDCPRALHCELPALHRLLLHPNAQWSHPEYFLLYPQMKPSMWCWHRCPQCSSC